MQPVGILGSEGNQTQPHNSIEFRDPLHLRSSEVVQQQGACAQLLLWAKNMIYVHPKHHHSLGKVCQTYNWQENHQFTLAEIVETSHKFLKSFYMYQD